jgi:hypothetical protein
LVGRAVGLHSRGLDVEIVRFPDGTGISVGNFATLAYSPPDEEIPKMDTELKAAYMLFVSGGLAGNKFAETACQGADADRKELARITSTSLEEIAGIAVEIIRKHRRKFRQLVSLIRKRFTERVWSNRNIQSGRHNLLTQEDLDKLFREYVSDRKGQEDSPTR